MHRQQTKTSMSITTHIIANNPRGIFSNAVSQTKRQESAFETDTTDFHSDFKNVLFKYLKAHNLRGFIGFNQEQAPSELDCRLLPLHVIQSTSLQP